MCGIAGRVTASDLVVSENSSRRMCDLMVYRGPDAAGYHTAPHVGLGERRLAIIDLHEQANPPLSNEDNSKWIVFNGEIYNFRPLRQGLLDHGHIFRTQGDTEVVLHLFEQYGIECLKYLHGMFAFAIWDSRTRTLFAARDRFGEKPFFYSKDGNSLIFASSIRCIVRDADFGTSPNFGAIDSYLSHQYVPSPQTAFCNIWKLPAAHFLQHTAGGEVKVARYWEPPSERTDCVSEKYGDVEAELLLRLRDSVRSRLISDVPIGMFLSGGLDSGTVTALMAQEISEPIKTFSIGFDEQKFDELPYARSVATLYGTDHHELVVRPAVAQIVPLLVEQYGEPFADSSAIPTYCVSQFARKGVKVVLSGDGGDETFLGYHHYYDTARWARFDSVPAFLRQGFGSLGKSVMGTLPYGNVSARIARACQMFGSSLPERYRTQLAVLKDEEKKACYTPRFQSLLNGHRHDSSLDLPWNKSMDDWAWMSRHDQHYYLPDCLMVKTDVASMANSLEVRSPLLDHQLVEFASGLPTSLKRRGKNNKVILRQAMRKLLPAQVLNKPKTGFGIPLAKWLRTDLAESLRAALLDERAEKRGLFHKSFLKRMIAEHAAGIRDWSNRLWALLVLELWF